MEYFDGLTFVGWGNTPHYPSHVDKLFANYYGIQYNHADTVYCAVNHGERFYGEGPNAIITYPGYHYEYGPGEHKERYHMFVCFNGPRAEEYVRRGLLNPPGKKPLIPIRGFDRFFMNLRELQQCLEEHPSRYASAVNLLESLLLQIHEEQQFEPLEDSLRQSAFRELAREIGSNPLPEWDFHKEADRMNISHSHFRRLFIQYLGGPPAHYVMLCRLKLAAEKLCYGEEKISTVALETGFYDVHHFSRMFRQHYHMPPAMYREEFARK